MDTVFWSVVVVGAFLIWIGYVAVDLEVPAFLAKWYREPGNSITATIWTGSFFAITITYFSPRGSILGGLLNDAIVVAITVTVLDELNRRRLALEEKERIIRQMASRSNDFALDAARIIVHQGWHEDGSLRHIGLVLADLSNAFLFGADLQGSDLTATKLLGACLEAADLSNCKMEYCELQESYLSGANLQKADLADANLENADLSNANLMCTVLWFANLNRANLNRANLRLAELIGANLGEATMDRASLERAIYTTETIWPEGFNPKLAGAILVEWDSNKSEWVPIKDTPSIQYQYRASIV